MENDICEIVVVRHGETVANTQGVLQGHLDTPLNETGVIQAQAIAERLKNRSFDAIYSSDLQRAANTARAIVAHHSQVDIVYTEELREWNLGDLQGKSYSELNVLYPEIMKAFRKPGGAPPIPGGENIEDFQQRIGSFLDKVAADNPGKKILLVSHGGAMQRMLVHTFGKSEAKNIQPLCANASMSVFRCIKGQWQLVTWNDTAHLENIKLHDTLIY